jgi:hypothetical protein
MGENSPHMVTLVILCMSHVCDNYTRTYILGEKIWGRCYDHNYLRFLPIFGEKIGVFLKNHCYDPIFCIN